MIDRLLDGVLVLLLLALSACFVSIAALVVLAVILAVGSVW